LLVTALLQYTFVKMSNIPFQFAEAVHNMMEMELPGEAYRTPTGFFSNPDIDDEEFEALVDSWALPPPLEDVKLFSPQPIADSDITFSGPIFGFPLRQGQGVPEIP
jgi:hypothetical protein